MFFNDFITEMSPSALTDAEADGNQQLLKLRYEDTYLEITFYPLEPGRASRVCSDVVVAPIEGGVQADFYRKLLEFNRKALGVLNASFKPDGNSDLSYRLTWYPATADKTKREWQTEVRLFAKLFEKFDFDSSNTASQDISQQHYLRL